MSEILMAHDVVAGGGFEILLAWMKWVSAELGTHYLLVPFVNTAPVEPSPLVGV